jgi:DNA-binding transcriptional MerR regulator
MEKLLTTGEFSKLSSTTKRTISWYDTLGILNPVKRIEKYRYYEEKQILDYQMIHLLTTLGISLQDIAKYLKKNKDITSLFNTKKKEIEDEIMLLQFNLNSIEKINQNLKENGTMVNPKVQLMKPFEIYYIEKFGAYSKINEYCNELLDMFNNAHGNCTTMTIFLQQGYRPKESKMKICLIPKKELIIKKEFKDIVKKEKFNPRKVISYVHNGSGSLLSLFWKQLERYCKDNKIVVRKELDFEIYHKVSSMPWEQKFEIFLPIK